VKPGRRPKPYVLKAAEGFRGHRKHSQGIEVAPSLFDPPFRLKGIALREWNRILGTASWLRETESAAIADRCLCHQRVQEAEAIIRKEGFTIRSSRGEIAHPAVRIARAYRTAMQRYDAELGLTPSSRANLQLPGASGDGMDPLERALYGLDYDPIERKLSV
jgi:P27 family predicted phage terminase small subunit